MISVIVPVYNEEKHIRRCIESVLSQTYFNFELLLIDDGSSDASGLICDEYADKDTARRLIDFLSGAVYGVDGHIQKVSTTIFLIVPYNVDVLSEGKEDKNKGAFPWIK